MKKRKFKDEAKNIGIIYEDDYILAVNKPARLASVPDKNTALEQSALGIVQQQFTKHPNDKNIDLGEHATRLAVCIPLKQGTSPPSAPLRGACGGRSPHAASSLPGKCFRGISHNQPLYLLHRLDYQTSGVLLFGKRKTDRRALEGIFAHAETRKKYLALVKGAPHAGEINIPLPARNGKEKIPALTAFKTLRNFRPPDLACSLVEAEIKTGRKHQIRLHFAHIGCPLVMDNKYGDERFNRRFRITFRLGRLFLHAQSIAFFHPLLKKTLKIEAPLPPDLKITLKRLEPF